MSAATIVSDAFGEGADLYEHVLGVSKHATPAQLRKAYYRKALQYHPDKQQQQQQQKSTGDDDDDDAVKKKFHAISVAHDILKDPVKRAEYDASGELVDHDYCDKDASTMWTNYFQQVFGNVTTNDIDQFILKYKCSDEEEQDVLKYYEKFQGNLLKMLTCVMASEPRDAQRWVEDYLLPAMDRGEASTDYKDTLEKTLKKCIAKVDKEDELAMEADQDATESEDSDVAAKLKPTKPSSRKAAPQKAKPTKAKAKKKTKAHKEAEAAEELLSKMRNKHALSQRQAGFEAMFEGIKDRYGVTDDDPLAGDAFDKAQAKLKKNSRK